jgi:hypothetical protein
MGCCLYTIFTSLTAAKGHSTLYNFDKFTPVISQTQHRFSLINAPFWRFRSFLSQRNVNEVTGKWLVTFGRGRAIENT